MSKIIKHTIDESMLVNTENKAPIPFTIPKISFDAVEQFLFALQKRDEKALMLLVSEHTRSSGFENKHGFISQFISYCSYLEKKYGPIHIESAAGKCTSKYCPNRHHAGICISVYSTASNKPLWNFDLVYDTDENDCVDICRCYDMKAI